MLMCTYTRNFLIHFISLSKLCREKSSDIYTYKEMATVKGKKLCVYNPKLGATNP